MFTEHPDGIREQLLSELALKLMQADRFRQSTKYSKAADKISGLQTIRNLRAKDLERTYLEESIRLYEDNIREMVTSDFPYTRLRIIYTRQKDYDAAIRVCQRFIEMSNLANKLGIEVHGESDFTSWIQKLQAKQS